ncbi:MAG: DUF1501 domain-containing protein [Gemmataceae bacterium]
MQFIQVQHGGGGAGAWDAHGGLRGNHERNCRAVDQPIAGLLKDLKRRGMLDETIVVFGTEFGRTPGSQGSDGRDHHIYGFSVWLAGSGIKGGVVHGVTDEIGFHAVVDRHYVTDIHATILSQLGLDSRPPGDPGPQAVGSGTWACDPRDSVGAARSKRFRKRIQRKPLTACEAPSVGMIDGVDSCLGSRRVHRAGVFLSHAARAAR